MNILIVFSDGDLIQSNFQTESDGHFVPDHGFGREIDFSAFPPNFSISGTIWTFATNAGFLKDSIQRFCLLKVSQSHLLRKNNPAKNLMQHLKLLPTRASSNSKSTNCFHENIFSPFWNFDSGFLVLSGSMESRSTSRQLHTILPHCPVLWSWMISCKP